MKLTSTQLERTLDQIEAEAIPDDHPVVPQLNDLFGEHTFFLDGSGLNIVEPTGGGAIGTQTQAVSQGEVVNVANWSSDNPTRLEPHEPQPTHVVVTLGVRH
jgi:hypothetical protein